MMITQSQLGMLTSFYLFVTTAESLMIEPPPPSFRVFVHKYVYLSLGDIKIHLKWNDIDLALKTNLSINLPFSKTIMLNTVSDTRRSCQR